MYDTIFSDPHLGTKRQAHTTRSSSQKLSESIYQLTEEVASRRKGKMLCLGDLFDKAHNDESTLVRGHLIADKCDMVIAGNHDETNRESATTTLRALETMMGNLIVATPDLSSPYFYRLENSPYFIVPHHASQEVFDKALGEALVAAEGSKLDHTYLLLHCNYNCPFDTEDSTLNLSPEMAEWLLSVFSRIFLGHEHNPKTFMGDRVVLVGNVHPTSFSDISDKFAWDLVPGTNELHKRTIWSQADHYREVKYGEELPDLQGVQFVDVVGAEPVEDGTQVAQFVRSVWEESDTLLAVRNNVQILDHLRDVDADTSTPALVDLRGRIRGDLEGSDLQSVYDRLVKRVEDA